MEPVKKSNDAAGRLRVPCYYCGDSKPIYTMFALADKKPFTFICAECKKKGKHENTGKVQS
jgi:hypothetical protein